MSGNDTNEAANGGIFGMKTSNAIIVAVLVIVIIGLIYFVFLDSDHDTEGETSGGGSEEECLKKFNIIEVVKQINVRQSKNLNRVKAVDF
jgi:preprotein translocase subunit SecG